MKWHLIVPVSLIGLVVVGGVALAAARHARGGGWRHDPASMERRIASRMEHVLDELDATDAQRVQAREILKRHAPDLKAIREHHEATRGEVEELWRGASLDPGTLRGLVDRKIEEARDAGYKIADAAAELHGILTPEQRAQLAEMAEERHGGRCRSR
jgi:Spy/CpxP family protein refolding chaperone